MINEINNEVKWFAFYTKSKFEKKVYERLQDAEIDCFLPLITTVKQWSDRKKKVTEPLIKSYVFVRTDEASINSVLKTVGIVAILKYLGKPARVRDYEIENLKIISNNFKDVKPVESFNLKKGSSVQVMHGPFMGLIGDYKKSSGKHKIVVSIEAVNKCFEVILPLSQIKVLKKP